MGDPTVYAIISDLHSNIEALEAVYEDMASQGIERVVCLGDAVGYGPNPCEVLDRIRGCEFILLGNHEEGLLFYAEDFNPRARSALEWTRTQLTQGLDKDQSYGYWQMIDEMKRLVRTDDALFVHASLRDETKDYVLPSDIGDVEKMDEIFAKMDRRVCFFGHTHVPGVWTQGRRFMRPDEIDNEFTLGDEKVCINVGSVGQPRDGDNRSCYAVVDGDRVVFRRVPYDHESTMRKIMKIGELSDTLAARLKVGR